MTGLTQLRERGTRLLLFVLAANAAAFAAYTLPRTLQERSLAAHAAALLGQLERERQALTRVQERAAAQRANEVDLAAFYKDVLEDPGQLVAVLRAIDKAAPSVGARGYHPAEIKGASVSRFVVTMPLSGSYQQLVAFLRAMENFEHFVTVDRVALRDKDGAASLDVEVSAYFRGPAEAKPKAQGT